MAPTSETDESKFGSGTILICGTDYTYESATTYSYTRTAGCLRYEPDPTKAELRFAEWWKFILSIIRAELLAYWKSAQKCRKESVLAFDRFNSRSHPRWSCKRWKSKT